MPGCSLCNGSIEPEGGAVLFTSSRGIPFEVCCECGKRFDTLQAFRGRPEAEAALDYITQYANTIEDRDAYDAVTGYAAMAPGGSAQDIEAEIARIREAKRCANTSAPKPGMLHRLARSIRWALFTILGLLLLAALLYMVYRWF
jgi:hypothetical protein